MKSAAASVGISISIVVFTGVLNNVSGKVKSKPLGKYNVISSIANSLIYTCAYAFVQLVLRSSRQSGCRLLNKQEQHYLTTSGRFPKNQDEFYEPLLSQPIIHDESLDAKKLTNKFKYRILLFFICIGFLEAIGSIMGLVAQAAITGPLYSISLQSIVVFSALIGAFVLNAKYSGKQIWAMFVVIMGTVTSLLSEYNDPILPIDQAETTTWSPFLRAACFASIGAFSTLPTAAAYAIKEHLFRDFAKLYGRSTLSIFTVGLLSSMVTSLILPPMLLAHFYWTGSGGGSPLLQVKRGAQCLMGRTPLDDIDEDCTWAPIAYGTYIAINVVFNFSLLNLVKKATSLITFLAMKAVLPIAIVVFAVAPLPLLAPSDHAVSPLVWVGLCLVLAGLALYQWEQQNRCALR